MVGASRMCCAATTGTGVAPSVGSASITSRPHTLASESGGGSMGKNVYQLKATIVDTKRPVWRRVVVPADMTLARLHDVFQAAFGWWECHLHEFEIGGARYGVDDGEGWEPPQDERRTRLADVAAAGSSFVYVYDFGDNWRHKVVVE